MNIKSAIIPVIIFSLIVESAIIGTQQESEILVVPVETLELSKEAKADEFQMDIDTDHIRGKLIELEMELDKLEEENYEA